jgi:putative acetyltransferase
MLKSKKPTWADKAVTPLRKTIRVREETAQDMDAIREVNLRAFGQTQEADIIHTLRQNCPDLVSLVALAHDKLVGHVLFSPVLIEGQGRSIQGMGLGPMSVLPEYQRQGIGSELVTTGIASLISRKCPFVIVLGHPDYYPRFGFEPASRHGIWSEWEVPDEAFMVLVLNESEMGGISGVAKYRPEFAEAL